MHKCEFVDHRDFLIEPYPPRLNQKPVHMPNEKAVRCCTGVSTTIHHLFFFIEQGPYMEYHGDLVRHYLRNYW